LASAGEFHRFVTLLKEHFLLKQGKNTPNLLDINQNYCLRYIVRLPAVIMNFALIPSFVLFIAPHHGNKHGLYFISINDVFGITLLQKFKQVPEHSNGQWLIHPFSKR
jgi:hypothetical protein